MSLILAGSTRDDNPGYQYGVVVHAAVVPDFGPGDPASHTVKQTSGALCHRG